MTELDALIIFWKDYRAENGAGLSIDEWEKVNDTIIYLEELRTLKMFGIVNVKVNAEKQ